MIEPENQGSKREVFISMLEQGMTMLHLDTRVDGIDVPKAHADDPHLRLNFSYKFHLETFVIDDEAIRASLSFAGTPYLCIIPWDAVFGMTNHVTADSRIWQESLPPELLKQIADLTAFQESAEEEEVDLEPRLGGAVRKVGHLRVIK